jgi:hypothetical protein
MDNLEKIQEDRKVKILFACESGSRGWGFASPDSDYDVRFIYMHPKDWYLSIDDRKDVIEQPVNDLLDVNGWDIRKALRIFRKSNAVLFEWLQSPVIYMEEKNVRSELLEFGREYFSPRAAIHHYLGLVNNAYASVKEKPQMKLKKYFYIIRSILAARWITDYNEIPPMEYSKLLPLIQDQTIIDILEDLLRQKSSATEADTIDTILPLHAFIDKQIVHCEDKVKMIKAVNQDSTRLDQYFRKLIA